MSPHINISSDARKRQSLERKREQDRQAQRASRERTKSRLLYLEERLQSFDALDQEGEVTKIARMADQSQIELLNLRGTLLKVRSIIDTALLQSRERSRTAMENESFADCLIPDPDLDQALRNISGCRVRSPSQFNNVNTEPNNTMEEAVSLPECVSHSNASNSSSILSPTSLDGMRVLQPGVLHRSALDPTNFTFRTPRIRASSCIASDIEKWHVSNDAFILAMTTAKEALRAPSLLTDFHLLYNAVTIGWDSISTRTNVMWNAFRQLDEQVFGTWTSNAQRIALLPSQLRMEHPPVIDFLIWPGLRDRLVFEYKHYISTGDFSAAFVENFNFHWPYSDADIFVYNVAKDQCEISEVFLAFVYDISNWTMRQKFFDKYPEMIFDIPVCQETIPIAPPL